MCDDDHANAPMYKLRVDFDQEVHLHAVCVVGCIWLGTRITIIDCSTNKQLCEWKMDAEDNLFDGPWEQTLECNKKVRNIFLVEYCSWDKYVAVARTMCKLTVSSLETVPETSSTFPGSRLGRMLV